MIEARPRVSRPERPRRLRFLKRVLVGRPFATERLVHERLGKPTALAVFASDNLSSSAYATEEILRVVIPVGIAAFALVVPITMALLVVLAILLFSYRQTIRAYPSGGGAYIVTRDNFGLLPAQVAGVALLTDYILTVSVSVSAGTAALSSAIPDLFGWRVPISVGFIALITWGNLRGIKESGRLFAAPTYFFIGMMATLLGVSVYRFVTGSLQPVETFPIPTEELTAVSLFLVLHAFSSGGAAVTGVEAISNGVPAFRKPEWRNARTTLMWMGVILGIMFLGLSLIAAKIQIVPDPHEKVTVLAQIGRAVFGTGGGGTVLFLGLQAATVMILVLAANTSFADFPRLASFHAADEYLPRQFTRYGDRLVFSNGILALFVASSALVVVFKASVTNLIPLYAIGVFTSFTFSQAGMTRHHLRLKEPGWRQGMIVNGTGAVVTAIMTVVIAWTKFAEGAWAVLLFAPIILFGLLRVNRHYREAEEVLRDPSRRPYADIPRQRVIVPVFDTGSHIDYALAYGSRVFPTELTAVQFVPEGEDPWPFLREASVAKELREVHLSSGDPLNDLSHYVRDLRKLTQPHELVNVIVPESVTDSVLAHLIKRQELQRMKAALVSQPGVVVTNVTHHEGYEELEPGREAANWRHIAVLLVGRVHNATLGGLRYARSLGSDELRCVHVGVEERQSERVLEEWMEAVPNIRLRILESPFRQITQPLFDFVREILAENPRTFVTIVIPEFVVRKPWHRLLHTQTALLLKGVFLFEPSVVVTSVPYRLESTAETSPYDRPKGPRLARVDPA